MRAVFHDAVMEHLDAAFFRDFFRLASSRLEDNRQAFCALDGAIGDGDHGSSMAGGFAAIEQAMRTEDPRLPADALRLASKAFLAEVGATVGPLYASGFLEAARRLQAHDPLPLSSIWVVLSGCAEGIRARGQAVAGDKTMLDVWIPAAQAAQRAESSGSSAAEIAALTDAAARAACENTAAMMAVRGRAARLQERSIGHIDPGAASAAVVIGALCDTVMARSR